MDNADPALDSRLAISVAEAVHNVVRRAADRSIAVPPAPSV